jgi:hypothetical protein
MIYPAFPVAGNTPVFLNAFDPSFMGGKFPVAATDPPAFGVLVGGLSALPVATSGGSSITTQQETPFVSAWATSPGFSHILPFYMPQRFGLKYNMVVINGPTDGGGT